MGELGPERKPPEHRLSGPLTAELRVLHGHAHSLIEQLIQTDDEPRRAAVVATFITEVAGMINTVDHETSSDGADTPHVRECTQALKDTADQLYVETNTFKPNTGQ